MMLSSPSRPASIAASSRAYTPTPISPGPAALASNGNVRITYTLAQTLQSSPHFAVLLDSLRSRVQPLRNLHWRPTAGSLPSSSIRTIQYLDAELVLLDLGTSSARLSTVDGLTGGGVGEGRSQIPGTVLAKPFINLWLGMCEDADTYKNVVRRQLKEWVGSVTTQSRRDQEWLIVLVNISTPGQDAAGTGGKRLFQMKGSIIDRMRADFTLAKRDRRVNSIYYARLASNPGGQDDPAAWTELIAKIKDSIVTTLDERIAERIDDVRRTEAQRAVPGWNFCTFFVLKETLAESFEGMTLLDAALLQYTELEASFYQVLKEKNLSWFGKLGGTAPGDDAAPLLSVAKKPYRDLILSNTISVFDFRCYLLARQCLLLARMGAIADSAFKATDFITTFARTLRENENSLSEPFLESWMYSCALNVVDECDGWIAGASGQESISDTKGSGYNAAKCELLELARAQLDKIGIRAGHLPRNSPFSTSLPEHPPKSRPSSTTYEPYVDVPGANEEDHRRLSRLGVTNPDILEAIDDPTAFDNLYKRLVTRTINTCQSSGRTRTETRLRGVLAALHLHRGQLPDAHTIYADLPPIYAEQHWTALESYMRAQSLATSEALEEVHNERWIHRALALVKADLAIPIQARPESTTSRIEQTLSDILQAADKLPKDLLIDNFLPLNIRPANNVARLDDTQDGSFFDVIVDNTFPVAIDAKFIRIKLRGRDGVDATFAHSETKLPPGESALSLFCPDPISGLFTTSAFEYQLSNLLFQGEPPESSTPTSTIKASLSETRATLRVPQDPQAAQVLMLMPRHVVLGDQRVLFKILTKRNTLRSGELSFTSQGSQVGYALESAKVLSEDCGSVRCTKDHIIMEDLPGEHELVLSVPFSGSPRNDELEAMISLAYTTVSQPEVARNVKLRFKEYVGLPLIVNINDKFRGQRLFTNVVIHSANQELIRIARVTLSGGPAQSKLAVKACSRSPVSVTVRPSRPAPFLFQIQASDPNEPPTGETLQLKITYRSLHEDLRALIERAVQVAGDHPTSQRKRKEARDMAKEVLLNDSNWIDMLELIYRSSENTDSSTWAKQLVDHAPIKLDLDSISDAIKEMKDTDHNSQLDDFDEQSKWRTVTMPFDVPLMNIINRARITPQISPDTLVYAGQPVDVTVTIESCFHWSGSQEDLGAKYLMRYDVLSDMDSGWLISGPKRGEYLAQDQGTHTLNITLLPLRHGVLSLPIVTAEPADDSGGRRPSSETWQSDGAQKITVLPRTSRSTYTIVMPVPVI